MVDEIKHFDIESREQALGYGIEERPTLNKPLFSDIDSKNIILNPLFTTG